MAKAGTNKSHPLTFAIKPIIESDKKTFKEYELARAEYDKLKSEKPQPGQEQPKKPVWKKSLLSDYTPEALAEVHKYNKRGIGVYCDELAGWFKNFNRYNKGSEMEFWLSAWSSKPINIDRKSDEPIFIPLPFISVAGTIQTGILNELAKESRTQNGFIDRILFVIPDNIKKEYWSYSEPGPHIENNWRAIITNLLQLEIKFDDTLNPLPEVLKFTPEASKLLYEWQRKNADQCNETENDMIAGIYSKIEMYAIRISLILQLLRWACNEDKKQSIEIALCNGPITVVVD